jgi:hypothetical protein
MLSEAKHLWILRFRLVTRTCSEILHSVQNDKLTDFIREISVIRGP